MPITKDTELAGPAPPGPPRARGSIDEFNVYDDARTYYTAEERHRNNRAGPRTRTYSQVSDTGTLGEKEREGVVQSLTGIVATE
jgi:alpha,alpha-trehalase